MNIKTYSKNNGKFCKKNRKVYKYMEIYSIMMQIQREIELDKKDLKILEILKQNGDFTTSKISKLTAIPITTIHNRIKKMKKLEIIKNYTINIDYKKIGKPLCAFIFVSPDFEFLKEKNLSQLELIDKIAKEPDVEEIYQLIGRYDIILKVRFGDMNKLHYLFGDILRKKYGIIKTETIIISYDPSNK